MLRAKGWRCETVRHERRMYRPLRSEAYCALKSEWGEDSASLITKSFHVTGT